MKQYFFSLVLLTACVLGLQAQETYPFVQRDTTLHLDIYRPTAEPNGYTVVHVFGGGFVFGARNSKWDREYCQLLAANGYTAVAIDYRLGLRGATNVGVGNLQPLEKAFYMAVEDCSAAVRFLVGNAEQLGIAPDKIILEGSSAGAITVLMTDFGRCNALPYAAELPEGWKPAGVVAYSGAIYSTRGALKWNTEPAPTVLFHGTVDKIVTYKQITLLPRGFYGANAIAKRLDKFAYPYCIYRFPDLGHEVSIGGPVTIEELNLFVHEYLRDARRLRKDVTMRDEAFHPSAFSNMTLRDLYKKKK